MIPFIPRTPPVAQDAAPEVAVPDYDGYPKRSCCTYCDEVIAQAVEGAPWAVGTLHGGESRECPKAPNPDEGPMPDHVPGVVLHPPKR